MLTIKYFTAAWCQPCKAFGPVFDQVTNETGINHQKINVDENKELVNQYMISSIPTIIFEVGGNIVHKHTGIMGRGQLLSMIQKFS